MDSVDVITELAATQFGGDAQAIDPDVPVADLGIDSLGFLEFLFEVEDRFGVSIPQKQVATVRTLRELAMLVDSLSPAAAAPPAG